MEGDDCEEEAEVAKCEEDLDEDGEEFAPLLEPVIKAPDVPARVSKSASKHVSK